MHILLAEIYYAEVLVGSSKLKRSVTIFVMEVQF